VTSQSRRPTCACAHRIRIVWSSVGAILLLATPAFCDTIRVNTYDSWRWNGFSWSPPPVEATLRASSARSSSGLGYNNTWRSAGSSSSTQSISTATSLSSLTYSALTDAGVSPTASQNKGLAGFVYVDVNNNGAMDSTDLAIADATVALTMNGAGDPLMIVYSKKDGSYSFSSLAAGVYSIAMLTPCVAPGTDTKGQIRDKDGVVDAARTSQVQVAQDLFSNIDLPAGYTGSNYNFAELVYPIDAVGKRMLLLGDDPGGPIHTTPEPGTLVLLAIAGACFGGLTWRRCRRSAA